MKITKTLTTHQSSQINQFWNDEYPLKLKDRFPILLDGAIWYNHYLVLNEEENVIAWQLILKKKSKFDFQLLLPQNIKAKVW